MRLTAPNRAPATLAWPHVEAGQAADAARLGILRGRIPNFRRWSIGQTAAPALLPLRHGAVVLGPGLGGNLVVAAVLAEQLLQVGRRVGAQPGSEAVAAHDEAAC